jgi:hypothetical protein
MGVLAGVVCYYYLTQSGTANDFTWLLLSAKRLLAGANPYQGRLAPLPYDPEARLQYPLPTVLLAIPFTIFSQPVAGALFIGASSALLAFLLTRADWWPLLLFTAFPFWEAVNLAQFSPLVVAAVLLPALPLALIKPNLSLPAVAAWPNVRGLLLSAAVYGASLLLLPSWPLDMLRNADQVRHVMPLLSATGPLLLLALLRWREPRARLLLAMAILPQRTLPYDQLLLWLIPSSWKQMLVMSAVSWGLFFLRFWLLSGTETWLTGLQFLVALACVFWPAQARQVSAPESPRSHAQPVSS